MNKQTSWGRIKTYSIRCLVVAMIAALLTPAAPVKGARLAFANPEAAISRQGYTPLQQASPPVCPLTSWSVVAGPNVSYSATPITGRSDFDWRMENTNRRFEGYAVAFAGELSLFNCLLHPSTCNLWELLWSVVGLLGNSHGQTTIQSIVLRLEGPPGAQAVVRASGGVDGLLVGAVIGVAGIRSKVLATLDLTIPGLVRRLVNVKKEETRGGAAQYSVHIIGSGSGAGSHTFQPHVGDQVSLGGHLRVESETAVIGAGIGGAFSYFQNVYPVDEIPYPGMRFSVDIINTYPMIAADTPEVNVDEGQLAILSGTYCDGDGDPLALSASLGTVVDNHDGTWSWSYTTPDGPQDSQAVVITANDGKGGIHQATFNLTVTNTPPQVSAGDDQLVYRFEPVMLAGTWMDPAGGLDNPYNWTWDLTGDGEPDQQGRTSYGESIPASTNFPIEGRYTLGLTVTDKDGGVGSDSLIVEVLNRPPVCSAAKPSVALLWPPNHQFVAIDIQGVTDPELDEIMLVIDHILQDEIIDDSGDGSFIPDGDGLGTSTALVRAERAGRGNGRVYHIYFSAQDGHGGTCSGEVLVGVANNLGKETILVDDGPRYDSTSNVKH